MTIDGEQPPQVDGEQPPQVDGEQPPQVEQTQGEMRALPVRETLTSRDAWDWVQLVGLGLLAAGVTVLVVFALTLGGR